MKIDLEKIKLSGKAVYVAFLLIIALLAVIIVLSQNWSNTREIKGVSIRDTEYIDNNELSAIVNSYIGKSRENVDLFEAESKIALHPFVESSIAKLSPSGKLIINIVEKEVVAYCSFGNGTLMLLDSKGEYLPYKLYEGFQFLPLITGLSSKTNLKYRKEAVKIIKTLQQEQNRTVLAEIANLSFAPDIKGYKLQLSNSDTELIIGRSRNISEKIKNFIVFSKHSIYDDIYYEASYIDLRWKNKVIVKKI